MGRKHWEKEKSLITSDLSFSHSVFKRLVLQTHKKQDFFGKWLICSLQETSVSGQAQLALFRKTDDDFAQSINVLKTTGDRSGILHIGEFMDRA